MATIAIKVITPERVVFNEDIEMITVKALDGLLGILPGHAPLVTGLQTGIMKIKQDGKEILVSISGGIMEVLPEEIKVVVGTAELPEEIDVERAQAAMRRAEERLNSNSRGVDEARARAALERAIARLKVTGHHHE